MIPSVGLKAGVRIDKLSPQMVLALLITQKVYEGHGIPCVVTSGTDGLHIANSLHYKGNGMDFRLPSRFASSPHLDDRIVAELKEALDSPFVFDVILETTHIHVEFDPKDGVS